MVQIVRRVVDRAGKLLSRDTLNVRVSSRQEAEDYILDHIARTFAHHSYNAEQGYWWGRQDDDTQVSRFTVEL